jgi:hypothetical protein
LQASPGRWPDRQGCLAGQPDDLGQVRPSAHARLGERSRALRTLEELKAASKKSYVPAFYFAMIYAALEDKDQAFMQLEQGYDERFARFAYLKLEALWDPLRSDGRFSELVQRVGIPP